MKVEDTKQNLKVYKSYINTHAETCETVHIQSVLVKLNK